MSINDIIRSAVNNVQKNEFNVDFDNYIKAHFETVYTEEEKMFWDRRFYFSAYLSELRAKNSESQLLLSLQGNNEFLRNILRKSIYEYYVGQRWLLVNSKNTKSMFNKNNDNNSIGIELMQLDMIIATIENIWVKA